MKKTNVNQERMKKAVAYMRYSTKNQSDNSIEYQRNEITRYCQENGVQLMEEFVDEGFSASNDRRPSFQRMMAESKKNPQWRSILVFDMSRIFRNWYDATQYKRDLFDHGFQIVDVSHNQISNKKQSSMVDVIIDIMNAQYIADCSEKTHSGMMVKAQKANHCGGIAPLGYKIGDKALVVEENEADTVRLIFRMYNNGYSYQRMADCLNAKGRLTKKKQPFSKNSFSTILTQRKYIGTYTWNCRSGKDSRGHRNNHEYKPEEEQVILPNGCPAIISKEEFERAAERMRDSINGSSSSKSRHLYRLGGMKLLRCKTCGRYMTGKTTKSHGKEYLTYSCPSHKGKKCPTKDVPADRLERFVMETLINEIFNRMSLAKLNKLLQGSADKREYNKINMKLKTTRTKLKNAMDYIVIHGKSDNWEKTCQNLEQEEKELQVKLQHCSGQVPEITEDNVQSVKNALLDLLLEPNDNIKNVEIDLLRRELLQACVEEILIDEEQVEVKFKLTA